MPHKNPSVAKVFFQANYQKNRAKKLAYSKQYRILNPERVAAAKRRCYERIKDNTEFKERRAAYHRRRRAEHYETVKAIEKRSYEKNKERILAYNRSIARTPKRIARDRLNAAVKMGKLPKVTSLMCCSCEEPATSYHHHLGYKEEHWLDVLPMCDFCHRKEHPRDSCLP